MSTTANPLRQTLDQRRAAHAWKAIVETLGKYPLPDKRAKAYGQQVKDLPTRILASGLGQALAFRWAKKDKDGTTEELLKHLSDWVLDKRQNASSTAAVPVPQSLLRAIIVDNADAMFLRRATEESIAYLQWLKRFAEAEGLTEGDNS